MIVFLSINFKLSLTKKNILETSQLLNFLKQNLVGSVTIAIFSQGTLTEEEGLVQLTSLY